MGRNGCDGSQASGPWAIGSGYRFNILLNPGIQNLAGHPNGEKGMVTAPKPLNAAALGGEPVVYYSGRVFLAMIVTLGQKLGAPEATPEHSAKDSKNIFERRFQYSNEEKSSHESLFDDSKIRTKTKFEGLQRMLAGLGE